MAEGVTPLLPMLFTHQSNDYNEDKEQCYGVREPDLQTLWSESTEIIW